MKKLKTKQYSKTRFSIQSKNDRAKTWYVYDKNYIKYEFRKIGPSCIIDATDNIKNYYWDNKNVFHRIDGPAIIENSVGKKSWHFKELLLSEENYWNK